MRYLLFSKMTIFILNMQIPKNETGLLDIATNNDF